MYADTITDSMRVAIDETMRRRKVQQAYNEEQGITPTTIKKSVRDLISISKKVAQEEMEFEKPNLYRIYAVIYVERDSQKGIIIGKRGAAIKRIGTEARKDLELLLGAKVFLDLSVKVRKNWRRDANQIRRFGYGEGA